MLIPLPASPNINNIMNSFTQPLPVELLIRILCLLSDFKDVVICSGVSRQFHEIVETSTPLQYLVELGLCGLVDSQRKDMTTAERLYRLRERENAWSTLSWRYTSRIPVGNKYIFWELCGGVFVGSYKSPHSPLPRPRAFDLIDIFELESWSKDVSKYGSAKVIALERRFCNFSIDPGQDLLILVEDPPHMPKSWTMHIRSLADGDLVHTRAARQTFEVPVAHESWPTSENSPGEVETQILGSVVLFSQRRGPGLTGSISVFNWTTGQMMFMIYPALGDWCCTLLSEKDILVAHRPSFRSQPCLEHYGIDPLSKWKSSRMTYLLPFGGIDKIWRPEICYSPASYTDTGESTVRAIRPFMPSPGPRLLAFRFICSTVVANRQATAGLDMFLLPELLKRYKGTDGVVPWETWGSQSTRWFKDVLPRNWRRNIHGYRAVLPDKNSVLDFNPNFWTEGDEGVVTQSSHIPLSTTSHNSVVSSLPYRTLQPPEAFGCESVMLDENLICVETDPGTAGRVNAFCVLGF